MKIEMIVEKTKTGYSAYSEKYPVYTTGKTLDEMKEKMVEALNLFFEKDKKKITEKDLKISLDPDNI
jgi:predicted RNase H-like HicB family nuclease